jgi:hypothetical protein
MSQQFFLHARTQLASRLIALGALVDAPAMRAALTFERCLLRPACVLGWPLKHAPTCACAYQRAKTMRMAECQWRGWSVAGGVPWPLPAGPEGQRVLGGGGHVNAAFPVV